MHFVQQLVRIYWFINLPSLQAIELLHDSTAQPLGNFYKGKPPLLFAINKPSMAAIERVESEAPAASADEDDLKHSAEAIMLANAASATGRSHSSLPLDVLR